MCSSKLCIIQLLILLTTSYLQGCMVIFPPNPVKTAQAAKTDIHYIISLHYLPERETDGAKAQAKLEALGYIVNRLPADSDLQIRVKGRPSYIYFNEKDFDVVMRLRRELSDLLGEEFNIFRSRTDRVDTDMRIILAGKDK
jgi:hypothetical protein